MKEIFRFLLQITLPALIGVNISSCKNDSLTLLIPPKQIVAPLLPDFVLTHQPVGLLGQLKNWLDEDHDKGKDILRACQIEDMYSTTVTLIATENTDRGRNLGQICDLFDVCKNWKHVYGPRSREYFAPSLESYNSMRGDHNAYSILLSSLQSSIGFTTEISIGYTDYGEYYAFPEVCLGPMDTTIIIHYIRQRYRLSKKAPVHIRKEHDTGFVYLSMERGPYPGCTQFEGSITMRLYLSDQFIEQFDR
jgi:hypothetical protein